MVIHMNDVANLIQELRTQAALTQKQLASAVRTTQQRVHEWEAGKRVPTWPQAKALGRYLRRDPGDFYKDSTAKRGAASTEPEGEDAPPAHPYASGLDVLPWPIRTKDGWSPEGCVYFSETFLTKHNLNPVRCRILDIVDDSMAPLLPQGSSCLVDELRTEPIADALYLLEYRSRQLIREAKQTGSGVLLFARKPAEPRRLRWEDVRVIGQVYWMGWIIGAATAARETSPALQMVADNGI